MDCGVYIAAQSVSLTVVAVFVGCICPVPAEPLEKNTRYSYEDSVRVLEKTAARCREEERNSSYHKVAR